MFIQELSKYPLSRAVRNGQCGSCPKILTRWIDVCCQAGEKMPACQQRQLQIDMLRIILDTICDCQIDKCWRGWCLDNIYRPMAYLRILSQSDQQKREVARIETEFRTLSHYFLV